MGYQEYPRHLHKPDGSYCIVGDDAAKAAKLAEGWNLQPGPAPVMEPIAAPVVEPAPAAPALDVVPVAEPAAPKAKRGRQPKV